MPGHMEFETIVASAPREQLAWTNTNYAGNNIPAGATAAFDLFAPTGWIGRVQSIYMSYFAQPGATSGDLGLTIGSSSGASGSFLFCSTTFNQNFEFNRFSFQFGGDKLKYPSDPAAIVAAIKDIQFDNVIGIRFNVHNNLNVAFTQDLFVNVNWIKKVSA